MRRDLKKEKEGILGVLEDYRNAWFTLQDIWIELQRRRLFYEFEDIRVAAQMLSYEGRIIIIDGLERYYKFVY